MSKASPRFTRQSARGHGQEFATPLPSTLADLREVRERAAQHRKVAARLAELRAQRVELARELAEQDAADERARAEAVAAGRSPARRQKAASLRKKLEEVEDDLRGSENGLARSADSLLEVAAPYREQALQKATEAQQATIARASELLVATDNALTEAESLVAERAWLARLDGRPSIEPYRGVGGDSSLAQLRALLRDAFADWRDQHERHKADFEERQRFLAEQEAQRLRHEEQALRDDRERTVVYEGMRLVEKGGRRVGPRGLPAEEEQP